MSLDNSEKDIQFPTSTKPTQVLRDTSQNITELFHASDIHIKNSHELFERYKLIFRNLINSISQLLLKSNPERQEQLNEVTEEALNIITYDIQEAKQNIIPFSNTALTVLCGDLITHHAFYEETSMKALRSLAIAISKLTGVIVILGNHEKSSRSADNEFRHGMDTLLANIPNLYLLIESGCYVYNNLIFNVFSLCDKKFPNLQTNDHQNRTSISLYHGQVTCINKHEDTTLEYDKLPLSVFKPSNYVLLGDCHKLLYLTETAAYPSSLIQQHRKESVKEHGFIHWDLVKKTSNHVQIYNPYAYVKFIFEKNVMTKTSDISEFNEVYYKCIDSDKNVCYAQIEDYIIHKNNKKIVFSSLKNIVTNNEDVSLEELLLTSKSEKARFDKIIDEYNSSLKTPVTDEPFIEEIKQYNYKLLSQTKKKEDDGSRNQKFKVCELYFSDMFTFGKYNHINFDNLEGVVGISGLNASGKSSILAILYWAIWGPAATKLSAIDVANTHTARELCTFVIIEQEGQKYLISRIRETNSSGSQRNSKLASIRTGVKLSKYDSKNDTYQAVNLNLTDNETNNEINDMCGPPENFVNIFFMMQDFQGTNFLELDSEIKAFNYFDNWIELSLYAQLGSLNNIKTVQLETNLKNVREQLQQEGTSHDDVIDKIRAQMNVLSSNKTSEEIAEIENEISSLEIKYNNLLIQANIIDTREELKDASIDDIKGYIDTETRQIKQKQFNVDNNKKIIHELETVLKMLSEERDNIHNEINSDLSNTLNNLKLNGGTNNSKKLNDDFEDIKLKISNTEKILFGYQAQFDLISTGDLNEYQTNLVNKIKEIEPLVKDTGKANFKKIAKDIDVQTCTTKIKKALLTKIKTEEKKISLLNKRFNDLDIKLKLQQSSDSTTTTNEIECLILRNNEYRDLINHEIECHNAIRVHEDYLRKESIDIENNEKIVKDYELVIDFLENEPLVANEINEKVEQKKLLKDKEFSNIKQIEMLRNKIKSLTEAKVKHEENLVKCAQLEYELLVCKYYNEMMQRNALPRIILEKVLLRVEKTLNEILKIFTDRVVKISIEANNRTRADDKCSIIKIVTTDETPINMRTGSGFEKFLINFSIRLAIAKTFNLTSPNFVAFDEKLSVLDKEKVKYHLGKFFNFISQNFQSCLVISHNPLVSKYFKHEIKIEQTRINDGTSFIVNNIDCKEFIEGKMLTFTEHYKKCSDDASKAKAATKNMYGIDLEKIEEKNKNMTILSISNNSFNKKVTKKVAIKKNLNISLPMNDNRNSSKKDSVVSFVTNDDKVTAKQITNTKPLKGYQEYLNSFTNTNTAVDKPTDKTRVENNNCANSYESSEQYSEIHNETFKSSNSTNSSNVKKMGLLTKAKKKRIPTINTALKTKELIESIDKLQSSTPKIINNSNLTATIKVAPRTGEKTVSMTLK